MAQTLPTAALNWLTSGAACTLAIEPAVGLQRQLQPASAQLICVAPNPPKRRNPGTEIVVADVARLPFDPCSFDTIVCHQRLHKYPAAAVLPELARVLRAGGHLCLSQMVRDDSVPWVKALVDLMHSVDPTAMQPPSDPSAAVAASKYFSDIEARSFRHWDSVTPKQLDTMVLANPKVANLPPAQQQDLLARVAEILPASRGFDLRLPYQVQCWRASVDHAELTESIELPDPGLRIRL